MSDDELEKIRARRRQQFMNRISEAKKEEEIKKEEENLVQKQQSELEEKKEIIMERVLYPDAFDYYKTLKSQNPTLTQTIENTLIYLIAQNQITSRIKKVELQIIERKIIGKEPTIKIKRNDDEEAVDIATKLKERFE
ncbi:MAG: hypothetical protein EAX96_19085 [Candidatus Lokiarchaeota archaeon]|nr:hypothetical protein [Candidatus Lokiarchaeota archaeon]